MAHSECAPSRSSKMSAPLPPPLPFASTSRSFLRSVDRGWAAPLPSTAPVPALRMPSISPYFTRSAANAGWRTCHPRPTCHQLSLKSQSCGTIPRLTMQRLLKHPGLPLHDRIVQPDGNISSSLFLLSLSQHPSALLIRVLLQPSEIYRFREIGNLSDANNCCCTRTLRFGRSEKPCYVSEFIGAQLPTVAHLDKQPRESTGWSLSCVNPARGAPRWPPAVAGSPRY